LFEAGKDQGAGIAGPILIAISVTVGLQLWRYNIVLSMAGGMIVHVTLATTITTGIY
jgi:branched-subunit amino acid transport protein AzlD